MTPTKDAFETGTSSADSQLSQSKNRTRPESPHLRADAVSLEIPIKAHGTLVPNLAPGASPQAQPFEEQTTTMIVFPQGGVLKMSTSVTAGQVMVLTNLKSRQDAICRVVKVRAYGKTQSYVEVEFTNPQPAYWGVYFPTDGPEVARMAPPEQAAAPVPAATATVEPVAPPASTPEIRAANSLAATPPAASSVANQPEPVVRAEESAPSPLMAPSAVKPKLPESAFAAIGTQEDFLPPASVNKVPRASSFVNSGSGMPAGSGNSEISDAIDLLGAPSLPSARPLPKPEGVGREVPAAPGTAQTPAGRLGGASTPKSLPEQMLPTPKQMFGVELESASSAAAAKASPGGGSKAMAFVGIAALLAAVAGGAYYFNVFHLRSMAHPSSGGAAASAQALQPMVAKNSVATSAGLVANGVPVAGSESNSVGQTSATVAENSAPNVSSSDSALDNTEPGGSGIVARTRPAVEVAESRPRPSEDARTTRGKTAAPSQANVAIPSTFGALNSRPVVNTQGAASSVGAAPALEASAGPAPVGSALSSIAPAPPKLVAPPKPESSAPVRVGGKLLPPRLISSVVPIYPAIAQQANVTGTVVIDTTVEKDGHVSNMKVVSGPPLLRGAALDALRKWKYEPSRLNGEPIAVKLVVSIQFH